MNLPKIIPAGSGEKTQYLAHDFNDNTIRFILHYPQAVQADLLCSATEALIASLDILHSSFIPGNLGAYWHVNREYETTDFFTHIKTTKDPMYEAIQASLQPVDPAARTQLHCTLVEAENECAVTLNISHLCVDGSDGKYLLRKLTEAYNLILETGSAKQLNIKNGSRAAEQIYEELTPKEYLSLMKNPISSVKSSFPFPTEEAGCLRMVHKAIPADIMKKARQRAKAEGATVNDLLLAACYRAYASLPEIDAHAPMSIMSMMDLRQHCKNGTSDGLCNMSGSLPTTLETGVQGNFSDTLVQISRQTRAAKENPLAGLEGLPLVHGATHALPMWLLLQAADRVYGSMSIGLTNLGIIPCDQLSLARAVPDSGIVGGPLKKKPAMQVSTASFDGAAVLAVFGEYTQEDALLLQTMLASMLQEITEYTLE